MLKALDMSSARAWAVLDLIKALAILLEIAFKRSAWEPYIIGTGKKSYFSSSQKSYTLIASFPKVLLTTGKRLTGL